jgi:hypothetical protein
MMNGSLFATPEASIARQEPGPENDAAWHVYEQVLTHVVTRDEIIKLGKDPDTVARFDDEYWGLGRDAYMVQIDVMHVSHFAPLSGPYLTNAVANPLPQLASESSLC